jgi:muramoyltetrapeptide carboxypeptidase
LVVLCPPPVRPGDLVRVIAPSGPFDRTLFFRGLAWLAQHYEVAWSRDILERRGYLAGSDERRLAELNAALRDPKARAVVAARGGYGAQRITHRADFSALLDCPKWLVGFSDFTALHVEAWKMGVSSLHAPNVTALGRGDEQTRLVWQAALEAPLERRVFAPLVAIAGGSARGSLVGGNLTLLFASAASARLALPQGCLLFFEDVGEAPYRIDRMLTSLLVSRQLDAVAGICVGDLTSDGTTEPLLELVRERLSPLGIPILAGLPIGHSKRNAPLPLGVLAALDGMGKQLIVNPISTD